MSVWDIVLALAILGALVLAVRRVMHAGGACNCSSCSLADSCRQGGRCDIEGRLQ